MLVQLCMHKSSLELRIWFHVWLKKVSFGLIQEFHKLPDSNHTAFDDFLTFSDLLEYFVVVKLFDSSKLVRSNIDVLSTCPRLSVFVEALMSKNHHEGT